MNTSVLLDMVAQAFPDRPAVTDGDVTLSYGELSARSQALAQRLRDDDRPHLALVGTNSMAVPVALFGSARAGVPYAPLNYRLADDRLAGVVARLAPSLVVADTAQLGRIDAMEPEGATALDADQLMVLPLAAATEATADPDDVAVVLFTSGTTGDPKAALLRHRHLTSYVLGMVEPFSAEADEATLVSVPPYHVAAVAAVLTAVYVGRRIVYLPEFDAEAWVAMARAEAVTHAMLVPTMLRRIVAVLAHDGRGVPSLRHLSYGGGPMPLPVVEQAMDLLPEVDFVNAYGLTETASTVSVLGPDEHRAARAAGEPEARARLGSVGRPVPALELEVRSEDGRVVPAGRPGQIWVRGEQVAGEYEGVSSTMVDGWFPTRDLGRLDGDGYLFLSGRADDVIVRGGENLSPGEIEAVLVEHPEIADAAVVGVPDEEWGEAVAAAVVPTAGATVTADDLRAVVRDRLRSSRVPERIVFVDELPYNDTGKLVRRALRGQLGPE